MAIFLPSNASSTVDINQWVDEDAHLIDFSSEGLTLDDEVDAQPSAKRAKIGGGNSAVRKQVRRLNGKQTVVVSRWVLTYCSVLLLTAKSRGST